MKPAHDPIPLAVRVKAATPWALACLAVYALEYLPGWLA